MAMRPRGRTGNQPFRQPFRQTYETIKPRSEWKFENDATFLLVHLSGFVREQIRVMLTYIDDASLGIKIQGQRPLPNGRWSQFAEVFRIPETCDASKINSQFERGVLTVVMPKLIATKPSDQQIAEPKTTQERRSPSPQKSTSERTPSPKTTEERTPSPKTTEESSPTPSPQTSSPESSSGSDQSPQRQSPQRGEKKLAETATTQKPTSDEKTHKGEDKSTSTGAAVKEKRGEEEPLVEEKSQKGGDKSISSKGAALVDDKKEKKGADDQTEKSTPEKNNVDEIKGVVQGKESAAVSEQKKKGQDDDDDKKSGKKGENGIEEMNKREEEVKSGKGGVREIEERRLLVNMGTAVLVLMGVGALISYKIASYGKP
ncbi:hypothetical protein Pint_05746 [Pistacia integerrima]|uniref:Uncharacterized protein n=1 Tax=Pistacia integerrima TaxID=434235 RepID=A0ACC0Z4S1_9ROSI|nr:hypothetical protein Pint_05746 [Pistacia integerrima]